MGFDGEPVPGGYLFLEALDCLILEFHDLPAARADQVVMVALVRDIVVLRLGAEVAGLGQTCFAEEIQRAVNGRQSNMWVFFGQQAVHLFGGDVLVLKKRLQDVFALPRELELVLGEMVLEDANLFGRLGHVRSNRHGGIKN